MIRAALGLLLLVATAAAQAPDPDVRAIRADLEAEHFQAALAKAKAAAARRPGVELLDYLRAQAERGIARDLQRTEGYTAAIDYLETRLDHALLAQVYAEACLWGGQEARGIAGLRASSVPLRDRITGELALMHYQYRFADATRRAKEVGWPAAEEYYGDQAALRARLRARARTGRWVAAIAAAALLGAAAVLFRLAPSSPNPRPPAAAR